MEEVQVYEELLENMISPKDIKESSVRARFKILEGVPKEKKFKDNHICDQHEGEYITSILDLKDVNNQVGQRPT